VVGSTYRIVDSKPEEEEIDVCELDLEELKEDALDFEHLGGLVE
jgi:hypothetical protein